MRQTTETRLMSAILHRPDLFNEVRTILRREHFAEPESKDLWECMIEHDTACPDIIREALPSDSSHCVDMYMESFSPMSPQNVMEAARAVLISHRLDHLSESLGAISTAAKERKMTVEQICSMMSTEISVARNDTLSDGRGLTRFDKCIKDALGYVKDVTEGNKTLVNTGIPWIDVVVGGMGEAELVVIGARPSVGKSALGLQIALSSAMRHEVAYFTMEMSKTMLTLRALFASAGLTYGDFLRNGLDSERISNIQSSTKRMPKTLYISDTPSPTVQRIQSEVLKLESSIKKVNLIIVDHLHIMGCDDGTGRYEKLTKISNGLKDLAMQLNIPIIILAQLSRASASEEREPAEYDLRDSGAIEQDADRIYLLHRPQKDSEEWIEQETDPALILVKKNRNVGEARIKCFFRKKTMTFEPAPIGTDFLEGDVWQTKSKKKRSMN